MKYLKRLLAFIGLYLRYGRLARRLKGLYKEIEKEHGRYTEKFKCSSIYCYVQREKMSVWERRLRRILKIYHSDRHPPAPFHIIEMRELTWKAMNCKKPRTFEDNEPVRECYE